MINFRFHIVSLIAVFLALGLGVVMGATVIDEAIVDGLNARIDRVENEADAQREQNTALEDEVGRLQVYIADEYAVAGRLDGMSVGVVAPRGVEGDQARGTVDFLQAAGANAPGVLWLEEKWSLSDEDARRELAEILGPAASDDADDLREAGLAVLTTQPGVIPQLVDAGFVDFDGVGEQGDGFDPATYPTAGARTVLIDQSDASAEANELVASVLAQFVAADLPVVLGEVYQEEEEDGPVRGARLAIVRDDGELSPVVSTVDDLELVEGKVTTVFALAELPGTVGHYGQGADADAPTAAASP
jgi:copper transport outer membrane protein MctB